MNLQVPISQMKQAGQWPLSWTSAMGLVPKIKGLGDNVTGCEVGVSYGFNLVYTLDGAPNISKLYAIDPYMPYDDGPGGIVTQDVIDKVKELFLTNIQDYNNRVVFINKTSEDAVNDIPDESLDYIFIDGDHSYDAVIKDLNLYYKKVKKGGIFAGHDYHLADVKNAISLFQRENNIDGNLLKTCEHSTWYWYK